MGLFKSRHISTNGLVRMALLRRPSLTHGEANEAARSPEGSRELRRIARESGWDVRERWADNRTNGGRHKEFYLTDEEKRRILEAGRGRAAGRRGGA